MMQLRELTLIDTVNVLCGIREDERDQMTKFGGGTLDQSAAALFCSPGPKWAFADGKELAVLVGGFIPQRKGVYASWFLATDAGWREHGRAITDVAIERKEFMFENGAHRIETVCLASRRLAHRWYKTVGSVFESTLEGFCIDGSNAVRFVDVRRKH